MIKARILCQKPKHGWGLKEKQTQRDLNILFYSENATRWSYIAQGSKKKILPTSPEESILQMLTDIAFPSESPHAYVLQR